jgi:hypothetical protein
MVGNPTKFSRYDVLRCFLLIDKDVPRIDLAKKLGLGEGTVRTILDILKNKKLIDSNRQGHFLTGKGTKLRDDIVANLQWKRIPNISKMTAKVNLAFRIAGGALNGIGYKERDTAIKNGADTCIIMQFRDRLKMPGNEKIDLKKYEGFFHLKNGDILLICGAETTAKAEWAGISVSEEMNRLIKGTLKNLC